MLRRLITTFALLLLTLPAQASEWALEEWLAEPDVKLVAVEFYADWCKPCKEAAPKWEALRKKYASQGLKLVVVNLSEKAGGGSQCTRLPWNPDESICDPSLGDKLGVTQLPEAFVWSWQGNLLVDRGRHVAEIDSIIRRYLDDNPRVSVIATNARGKADKSLKRLVEAKLDDWGKFTLVSDASMRKRLSTIRKESHRSNRRDDQRCVLGAEVSANSLLSVERFRSSLSLTLADAESGCHLASVSEPIQAGSLSKAVNRAVHGLLRRMMRTPGWSGVQSARSQVFDEPSEPIKLRVSAREHPSDGVAADEWFFNVNGTQHGPMPWPDVVAAARTGLLSADDLVWDAPQGKWLLADDYDHLHTVFSTRGSRPETHEQAVQRTLLATGESGPQWYESWIGWTASGIGLVALSLSVALAISYANELPELEELYPADQGWEIQSIKPDVAAALGVVGGLSLVGAGVAFIYHRPGLGGDSAIGKQGAQRTSIIFPTLVGRSLGVSFGGTF